MTVPTPEDLSREIASSGVRKATAETTPTIMLAIAAGVFIALGAMFAISVGAGSELGLGPTRLLMGIAFSLGLFFVVVLGTELFTGNNLMVTSVLTHQVRALVVARNWTLVYLGNFVGSIAVVLLVYYSRWWEQADFAFGIAAVSTANEKVNLGFTEAFLQGVVANILVCLAVWMAAAGSTVTDKMLGVLLPIAAFVAGGFEHSIANMFFTPMGVLVSGETAVIEAAGLSAADIENLTWGGVSGNLLSVTLGNIVGGVLVGLPTRAVHLRHVDGRIIEADPAPPD